MTTGLQSRLHTHTHTHTHVAHFYFTCVLLSGTVSSVSDGLISDVEAMNMKWSWPDLSYYTAPQETTNSIAGNFNQDPKPLPSKYETGETMGTCGLLHRDKAYSNHRALQHSLQ